MKRVILPILLLIILQLSCKENVITPPDNKPQGYQEDLPWPSLADSPWPMNHHDPQNTGRSKFIGPINGNIIWIDSVEYMQASASFINDSLIVIAENNRIKCISLSGTEKWTYNIGTQVFLSPLVTADSMIISGGSSADGKLLAINFDGSKRWELNLGTPIQSSGVNIDKMGNIYVVAGFNLFAVSKEGVIKWILGDHRINPAAASSFSPDGNTIYISALNPSLLAVNTSNGMIKWEFGSASLLASPFVDSQGNIYFIPKPDASNSSNATLFSIENNWNIRWQFDFNVDPSAGFYGATGTIDKEGNIYFAFDTLYALDYQGKLKWKKFLAGTSDAPLICDINSNIYVSAQSMINSEVFLSKYSSIGGELWRREFTHHQVGLSPVIGKNGTIIFIPWRADRIYYLN
ncbi:MAG: PQQ-like beta-propeller repeat protein [Ignavibacteriales bacterium]|nr:MAG: PQQ-like beta-propeller repeat protein [Ignavibacteriales bacterium]